MKVNYYTVRLSLPKNEDPRQIAGRIIVVLNVSRHICITDEFWILIILLKTDSNLGGASKLFLLNNLAKALFIYWIREHA